MLEGAEDYVPVTSVVSHVARFNLPGSEVAAILILSRVSARVCNLTVIQAYKYYRHD
jgi:hypothetical protein